MLCPSAGTFNGAPCEKKNTLTPLHAKDRLEEQARDATVLFGVESGKQTPCKV